MTEPPFSSVKNQTGYVLADIRADEQKYPEFDGLLTV